MTALIAAPYPRPPELVFAFRVIVILAILVAWAVIVYVMWWMVRRGGWRDWVESVEGEESDEVVAGVVEPPIRVRMMRGGAIDIWAPDQKVYADVLDDGRRLRIYREWVAGVVEGRE